MKRTARMIKNAINDLRVELGMDVRSYPSASHDALLVLDSRLSQLKHAWQRNPDNIRAMHYTDIAAQFSIHEIDAKAFVDNIVKKP